MIHPSGSRSGSDRQCTLCIATNPWSVNHCNIKVPLSNVFYEKEYLSAIVFNHVCG